MKKRFIMSPGERKISVRASRTLGSRNLAGIRGSNNRTRRKAVTAAKVYTDGFGNYTPWSGAKDTWKILEDFGKIDALEAFIDEVYYNDNLGEGVIDETELNDFLWFEPETVYEAVGLYYNPDTDEVSDEPFDDEVDEEYVEESTHIRNRNAIASSKAENAINRARALKEKIAKEYGVSDSSVIWKGDNKFIVVTDGEEVEVTV